MLLLFQKTLNGYIQQFFWVFFPSSYFWSMVFCGGVDKGTIGKIGKKRYWSSICGWSLFIRDEWCRNASSFIYRPISQQIFVFSSSFLKFKGDPHLGRSPPPTNCLLSLSDYFPCCSCCSPLKTMLYNMLSLWEKLSHHQKTMAGLFKKSSVG